MRLMHSLLLTVPSILPSTTPLPNHTMNPEKPDGDKEGGVGLSDSLLALRRRRMLDIVNALHLTGYVLYLTF